MSRSVAVLIAGLALVGAAPAAAQDAAKAYAQQCAACHQAKSTPMAPSLAGAAGGKIAARGDFTYSAGLKKKAGQAWTDANLDAFLKAPATFAPGTRMFAAVPAAETRAVLIKHLKTLK